MNHSNRLMTWLSYPEVKFKIISFLQNREFALFVPSWCDADMKVRSKRTLRCHNVQQLDFIINQWLKVREQSTIYNMFYSLATYKDGIPMFKGESEERKEQLKEWRSNDYWKQITGVDLLIDIDAGDISEIPFAHYTAKQVKELLDKFNVPYELRFSGMGFHIIIPYSYFKSLENHFNPDEKGSIWDLYTSITKTLFNRFSEMIDWNINDSRRVTKIPYSIAMYNNDIFMCFPFNTDQEFNDFKIDDALPIIWLGKIRHRKTNIFNENYLEGNPTALLKELEVKING